MTGAEAPSAAGYGLAPRPEVDPEILAVLTAAVDQAWPRRVIVLAEEQPAAPAWRFSGRWWAKPSQVRRERPWTSR